MPRITRTLEGYKCAECGKTFSDVEHWPVPELVIGGDGRDCVKKLRVHVQTQYDYEYSYLESTLCLSCQRKLLLTYLDRLYPTIPPEPNKEE